MRDIPRISDAGPITGYNLWLPSITNEILRDAAQQVLEKIKDRDTTKKNKAGEERGCGWVVKGEQ